MEEEVPQQTTITESEVQQPSAEPQQGAEPAPQTTEGVQQPSATQQPVAAFPQLKKKTDEHSITVRSAVRVFEDAQIPRSPRTIVNYCNPNTESVTRLDCWQDPKDRAYYITQESIEEVIAEEKAKGRYGSIPQPELRNAAPVQQPAATSQQSAEPMLQGAANEPEQVPQLSRDKNEELRELRRKTVEQVHTITGKDIVIEQLQAAWDKLAERLEKQSELVGGLRLENNQLKALNPPQDRPENADVREALDADETEEGERHTETQPN